MSRAFVLKACVVSWSLLYAFSVQAGEVRIERAGYQLQAEQQGEGPVTVVFESGFGQGPGVWKDVIADLGAQCRCVAYARAGLGKSGSDGTPKTIEAHLQDLGAVMDRVATDQKVILVGHSYGGLLASEFARLHPGRLHGLVLVDPATLTQRHAFKKAHRERVIADDEALLATLPPAMAADYKLLTSQLDSESAASPRTYADLPVALLTATQVAADPMFLEETPEGKALWKRQHAQLFVEFSRGTHQYLVTGHNIHRERPKAVADALRLVAATAGN